MCNYSRFSGGSGTKIGGFILLYKLGSGSFGDVWQVQNSKTKLQFAMKIIRAEHRFRETAITEAKVLDTLGGKHNCVQMETWFSIQSRSRSKARHTCIVFPLYGENLYTFYSRHGRLPGNQVFFMVKDLIVALVHLKKNGVIHADLKPENILMDGGTSIQLIDFGSSCFENRTIFKYIQSRFYRAPEVMFQMKYGTQIDMWSLGCVIYELLFGKPLFNGKSEGEMMVLIAEVLGLPTRNFLDRVPKIVYSKYFERDCVGQDVPHRIRDKRGKVRIPSSHPLSELIDSVHPVLQNIMMGCLTWDPSERLTPEKAYELLH